MVARREGLLAPTRRVECCAVLAGRLLQYSGIVAYCNVGPHRQGAARTAGPRESLFIDDDMDMALRAGPPTHTAARRHTPTRRIARGCIRAFYKEGARCPARIFSRCAWRYADKIAPRRPPQRAFPHPPCPTWAAVLRVDIAPCLAYDWRRGIFSRKPPHVHPTHLYQSD